jgi:polyhydroxybutyrate depolymerase
MKRLSLPRRITILIGAVMALISMTGQAAAENTSARSMAGETCQPARYQSAGLTEHNIESNGRLRHFSLYVPRSYSGEKAMPVVFDLHATGISPAIELKITSLDKAAEENEFVTVMPAAVTDRGGGPTWNIPHQASGVDDVAFVEDVLERANKLLCLDAKRVYATGFSGGARFASELACRMPDHFAAIGAVGGLRHPAGAEGECKRGRHIVPIIAFHSTNDPVNPYEHHPARSPAHWTYGVDEALRRWTNWMGCATSAEEQLSKNIIRFRYADCKNGVSMEFYRLSGTGHTWPGSSFAFSGDLGATEDEIDATALTLQFFERYRLLSN